MEHKKIDKGTVEHSVIDGADVLISITIGNGQKGAARIEDTQGNLITSGNLTNFNLGSAASLRGKIYTFFTNVLDVSPDPAHKVVIKHRFTNSKRTFEYNDTAPEGGIFSLTIKYKFV